MIKLPTGDKDGGASTGKLDFVLDAVLSKELNQRVEVSGYGGFIFRGEPDAVETTNGFRWGIGAGMPSRKALRLTAELEGETFTNSTLQTKQLLLATDGSFLPVGFVSDLVQHRVVLCSAGGGSIGGWFYVEHGPPEFELPPDSRFATWTRELARDEL